MYNLPASSGTTGLQGPVTVKICAPNGTTVGNQVTVNVTANYTFLPIGNLLGGSLGTAGVTGTATMRLEQPLSSSWVNSTSCT